METGDFRTSDVIVFFGKKLRIGKSSRSGSCMIVIHRRNGWTMQYCIVVRREVLPT